MFTMSEFLKLYGTRGATSFLSLLISYAPHKLQESGDEILGNLTDALASEADKDVTNA